MPRVGLLIVLVLATTVSIGHPASATPIDAGNCIASTESVETDFADINALVEQAPNKSNVVRITYERLSSGDRLEIQLPSDVTIVRAKGFTREDDSTTVAYTGGERGILEYKIGAPSGETRYANGSNWIFAPVPTHIGDVGVNLKLEPNGVVGNEFLYIGNYTEYSTTDGCHKVSVVNAAAGDLPQDPSRIIRALNFAASNLNIGHKYETVTIFLTPGFAHPPNPGFARTSDAWVTKSTLAYGNESYTRMVLHEYVHTRQAFNRASIGGMSWIIESSADYFSYQLALEVGAVTPREYNNWLQNGSQMGSILTDRSTWESEYVPYARGGAYLAVLDQRIQATSNESIESVFRQINAVGGDESNVLVQRSLFLDTVENTSSESVRNWANTSMGSENTLNVNPAKANVSSNSVTERFADRFERRIAKKPYMGFLVAVMMGVFLGMLPYEIRRDNNQKSESDD